MSSRNVSAVYDRLVRYEAPRHAAAYPVHKRLRIPGGRDVYDLITDTVTLAPGARILDAGSGTGFGTLRLAQATGCEALGISLSAQEVRRARENARAAGRDDRVAFEVSSFDDVGAALFDLVVAVESLKHSADLGTTLSRLYAALRPGGSLVVVDDVLTGAPDPALLERLADAWALSTVYRRDEFTQALPSARCSVEDLTGYTRRASPARLWLHRQLLGAAAIARPRYRQLSAIYGAGLDLQALYRQGHMHYLKMRWSREQPCC